MKKIMKRTFVLLLVLGMVFSQTNVASASQTSDGYLTASKSTTSVINLKLRKKNNFFYKGDYDLRFTTLGEKVRILEVERTDPNWVWDDDYRILVQDRIGRRVITQKFRAGNSVRDDLRAFFHTFNRLKKIKVGHTLTILGYWSNTIKPKNSAQGNLYLAKPAGRSYYSFVFTSDGLVEDAGNVLGKHNNNTSYILIPIKMNGYSYNERLYVDISQAGNVSFRTSYPNSNAKMAATLKVHSKRDYRIAWYNANAKDNFYNITNYLNSKKLKLGDTISLYFERFDVSPRLGRSLKAHNKGNYSFQKGETKLKLTRYGFLTSDGFLVSYVSVF